MQFASMETAVSFTMQLLSVWQLALEGKEDCAEACRGWLTRQKVPCDTNGTR